MKVQAKHPATFFVLPTRSHFSALICDLPTFRFEVLVRVTKIPVIMPPNKTRKGYIKHGEPVDSEIADYSSFNNHNLPHKPPTSVEDLPDTPNTTMSMFINSAGGDSATVEEPVASSNLPSKPPLSKPMSKKNRRALAKRPPTLNLQQGAVETQPPAGPVNPFQPFDFRERGGEHDPSLASTNAAEYHASPVWYPHAIAPQLPIRQKHKPLPPLPVGAPAVSGKGTLVQRSEVASMAGVLALTTPAGPPSAAPLPSSSSTLPPPDHPSVLHLYNTTAAAAANTRSEGDKSAQGESGQDEGDGEEEHRDPSVAALRRKSGLRRCFSSQNLNKLSSVRPSVPPPPTTATAASASQYVTVSQMEERLAEMEKKYANANAIKVLTDEAAELKLVLSGLLRDMAIRPAGSRD